MAALACPVHRQILVALSGFGFGFGLSADLYAMFPPESLLPGRVSTLETFVTVSVDNTVTPGLASTIHSTEHKTPSVDNTVTPGLYSGSQTIRSGASSGDADDISAPASFDLLVAAAAANRALPVAPQRYSRPCRRARTG